MKRSETGRGSTTVGATLKGLLCPPGHLSFRGKEVRGYTLCMEDNWVLLKLLIDTINTLLIETESIKKNSLKSDKYLNLNFSINLSRTNSPIWLLFFEFL